MRTYYIISTTNPQVEGWSIYRVCNSRKEAELEIDNIDEFKDKSELHNDIYAQTLLKNSRVVSKTEAERKYHCNDDDF